MKGRGSAWARGCPSNKWRSHAASGPAEPRAWVKKHVRVLARAPPLGARARARARDSNSGGCGGGGGDGDSDSDNGGDGDGDGLAFVQQLALKVREDVLEDVVFTADWEQSLPRATPLLRAVPWRALPLCDGACTVVAHYGVQEL